MRIKSWRDVIHPHDDVLEGDLQAASFAADLTKDVEATHLTGFDTTLLRSVRENPNTLGFAIASFEDE